MVRFFSALRGGGNPRQPGPSAPPAARTEVKSLMQAYTTALAAGRSSLYDHAQPWPVERAVAEAYERVVWAFKCVQVISGSESRLQVRAVDEDGDEVEDDPYVRLLNGQANPLENGQQLRKRLVAQILLSKRGAMIEESVTNGGKPYRLDLLPPGRTRPIPGRGADLIDHWEVTDVYGYKRAIDVERVIWFRDPHPLDPYSGVTPLEAAGLSIELDYFARIYNASFMRNDGRPGGIVAVRGTKNESGAMTDREIERVEQRFGKGPVEAGKITVVSGDISYVDPTGKPRDIQYAQLSGNTKAEILGAFGVPLSVIGDASGRTFDNADKEGDNFWLVEPMPNLLDLVQSPFTARIAGRSPGVRLAHNTDDIEPVLRAEAAKRAEARDEVNAGLRSIFSYAELARIDGVDSTPHTRALYMATGKTPIPATEDDAKALGLTSPDDAGAGAPGGAPPADGAPPPTDGTQPPATDPTATPGAPADAPQAAPGAPDATAAATAPPGNRTPQQIAAQALQGKSLAAVGADGHPRPRRARAVLGVKAAEPAATHQPDHAAQDAAAEAIGAAVAEAVDRLIGVAVARVRSPKQRRGTRHFTPEFSVDTRVGTKALDTARAVDADQWSSEVQAAARPHVEAAAGQAADAAVADLGADVDPGTSSAVRDAVKAAVTAAILGWLASAAVARARKLAEELNLADQAGESLAALIGRARAFGRRAAKWAHSLGVQAAVATFESATGEALTALVGRGALDPQTIRQTWMTRMDEHVRPTHKAAQGQSVGIGAPFAVGAALLRYPGDPLGPLSETAGCRCFRVITVGSQRVTVAV